MNQFVWDMLYPQGDKVPGMLLWNGTIGAPKASPGRYKARIRYDKDSADVSFLIKGDPNYKMTEADYDLQVGFLLQIRDKFNEIQKAVTDIRSVRSQLNELTAKLDTTASTKKLKMLSDSISKQLTSIEEALYQTKSKSSQDMLNYPIRLNDKLAGLYGVVASGNQLPSKQSREVYAELTERTDAELSKLKGIMKDGLGAINKIIHEEQVPVISLKK